MKQRVYLETTIVSYLASRPSRDVVVAGRQQVTHRWWEVRRPEFDLVVSQVVLDEIRAGDPEAAARRLDFVAGLPLLDVTPDVAEFAAQLIDRVPLPAQAAADAAHMAIAACHGVDFVLTWNPPTSPMQSCVDALRISAGRPGTMRRSCARRTN